MKKLLAFLTLAGALMAGPLRPAMAAGGTTGGTPIDKTVAPLDFQEVIDLQRIDRYSLQANYDDGTPASKTFDDGRKSTATITVTGSTTAVDGARLAISTVFLVEGTDWTSETSTSVTANNISDAIMANATLSAIITSTWSANVVYATANVVGVNAYALFSSTPTGLVLNGDNSDATQTFLNGAASDVETDTSILGISSDTIRIADHGFVTGLGVLYSTAGVAITGLTDQTTYYVIKTDGQDFKLATSTTNAAAGTAVDITALAGGGTYTLAPMALSGTPSFKWQASNDNANWTNLSLTSVTWSAAGTSFWDVGNANYRYLRLNYTHPSAGQGGLSLTVHIFGRLDD